MSRYIVLKNGRSGYDAVWEYIEKYWKQNGYATAIVALESSYDGREYRRCNEVVCPTEDFEDCEFLHDWWEGEEYIRILGVINVDEIDLIKTADAVEVVRCKDCANCRYVDAADIYRCDRRGYYSEEVKPSDYCSFGERKEDER